MYFLPNFYVAYHAPRNQQVKTVDLGGNGEQSIFIVDVGGNGEYLRTNSYTINLPYPCIS